MRPSTNIGPKSFLYEERGAVAFITLNRPDRLNSLTFEVYRELSDALAALRSRDEVRVVVITGRGRGFCSGGDVEEIIGELFSRDMSGLLEFTRMTCDLIRRIRALNKPVIASLNGTVAGAGCFTPAISSARMRQAGSACTTRSFRLPRSRLRRRGGPKNSRPDRRSRWE